MLRTKRPGFSIKDTFAVHPSRDLPFNGETFVRGTIFPWKEAGCTARRLNLLFKARKVLSESEFTEPPGDTKILGDEVDTNEDDKLTEKEDKKLTKTKSKKTDKKLTKDSEARKKKRRDRKTKKDKNDNKDNNKTTKPRSRRKLTKPRS